MTGIGRLMLAVLAATALNACTTLSKSGLDASSIPAEERLGSGASVIGVLSFSEAGNLAGGAEDGSYQAARLAATTILDSPITIEIRNGKDGTAQKAAQQLADAGARIAILPADLRSTNQAAGVLAKRGIPSISLARAGDAARNLYGAGFDLMGETAALADEVAKRGITKVALVTTANVPSQVWAAVAAKALMGKGVAVQVVDATDFDKAQRLLIGLSDIGGIVFATSPEDAAGIALVMRVDPARAKLAFFSSAEWALASPVPASLKGTAFAAPADSALKDYARRFSAASGKRPTLGSVLVYDLIVMSAVLQQTTPNAPYERKTLTSPDGFVGFSGAFSFDDSGLAMPRNYSIYAAE